MILGFKERFVEPILNGVKIHTIREDRHNRWEQFRLIQFATGVRTKQYNCFKELPCDSIQKIEITYQGKDIFVYVDGMYIYDSIAPHEISINKMLCLAINDGFKSLDDFFEWFNKDFTGKIIHWTNFRY
jgi:hypothetical protein